MNSQMGPPKNTKQPDANTEPSFKTDVKNDSTQSETKTKQPPPTTNTRFDEMSGTHANGSTNT